MQQRCKYHPAKDWEQCENFRSFMYKQRHIWLLLITKYYKTKLIHLLVPVPLLLTLHYCHFFGETCVFGVNRLYFMQMMPQIIGFNRVLIIHWLIFGYLKVTSKIIAKPRLLCKSGELQSHVRTGMKQKNKRRLFSVGLRRHPVDSLWTASVTMWNVLRTMTSHYCQLLLMCFSFSNAHTLKSAPTQVKTPHTEFWLMSWCEVADVSWKADVSGWSFRNNATVNLLRSHLNVLFMIMCTFIPQTSTPIYCLYWGHWV